MDSLGKLKNLVLELEAIENKTNGMRKSLKNVEDNIGLSKFVDKKAVQDYFSLEANNVEQIKQEIIDLLQDDDSESEGESIEQIHTKLKQPIEQKPYILPTQMVECACGVKLQKRRLTEHYKTARHVAKLKNYNLNLYNKSVKK